MHVPAEARAHARIALRDRRGAKPCRVVDRCGEHPAVRRDGHAERRGCDFALLAVGPQEHDGVLVEGDASLLVGLGVLLPRLLAVLADAGLDRDDGVVQFEPVPAQGAELTTPGAGRHREPDHHAPPNVRERGVEDGGGFLGGRGLRIMLDAARGLGLLQRVDADPVPADGTLERPAEPEVHLPDRRRGERPAGVRPALFVAVVLAGRPVLGEGAAGAVRAAPPEDRVERVERLAIELADLEVPEQRPHVVAGVPLVPGPRGHVDVEQAEVPVHELIHGDLGTRAAALVDLALHSGAGLLGELGRVPAGRDDLSQVVPLAGDRIDPGRRRARAAIHWAASRSRPAAAAAWSQKASCEEVTRAFAPRMAPRLAC